MKVLVAYHSETGNTEKVARAIHEEASAGHEADLKKVGEVAVEDLNDYDLVFLGSTCHSADLASPVKELLNAIPESPGFSLAGFFTHSTPRADHEWIPRAAELFERWAGKCSVSFESVKKMGVDFRGCYNCQGAASPGIEEFIHRSILPDDVEFQAYVEEARKHPTAEDLDKAREFARDVLQNI